MNQPPTLSLVCEAPSASPRGRAECRANAADPDGDVLDYSCRASSGRLVGSGPVVSLDPGDAICGSRVDVECTVSDGRGGTAVASAGVRVDCGGRPFGLDHVTCSVAGFPMGDAALSGVDLACLAEVARELESRGADAVVVTGLAEPTEPVAPEVAQRRAEAVAAWLRARGVGARQIRLHSEVSDTRAVAIQHLRAAQAAPGPPGPEGEGSPPPSPPPPPLPTPRPEATPRPSVSFEGGEVAAQLPRGNLFWGPPPPERMVVGTSVSVGAALFPEGVPTPPPGASPPESPAPGAVTSTAATPEPRPTPTPLLTPISPKISARLFGAGFDVEPEDEREQSVSLAEPTYWTWDVTAREAGPRTLTLEVKVYLPPHYQQFKPLQMKVEVTPVPPSRWERLKRLWEEMNKLWAAPVFVLLLGAAGEWLRRRRKKKTAAGLTSHSSTSKSQGGRDGDDTRGDA